MLVVVIVVVVVVSLRILFFSNQRQRGNGYVWKRIWGACILMERAARQSKQVKGGRSEQSGKGLSGRRKCGGPGSVVNSAAKKALLRMR